MESHNSMESVIICKASSSKTAKLVPYSECVRSEARLGWAKEEIRGVQVNAHFKNLEHQDEVRLKTPGVASSKLRLIWRMVEVCITCIILMRTTLNDTRVNVYA